ncbi:MAG: DUF4385 domain-containing protein [Pseudomonadota bacterium]
MSLEYAELYRNTNFRDHPEKYPIGKGEQGVLMAEPYKSEILPYWRFKTPDIAQQSADKIYALFNEYKKKNDFVGMDMARKFLQMGWTRARRYANHPSGKKYNEDRVVKPQSLDAMTSDKAKSAAIFFKIYNQAKDDPVYLKMKQEHQLTFKNSNKQIG